MRATKPANGRLVALTSAPALALGKNLASPILSCSHFLPELAAQPEISSEIRDIIYGHVHWSKEFKK